MLIYNKDDLEFVTEFSCLLGHPVLHILNSNRVFRVIFYFIYYSNLNLTMGNEIKIQHSWMNSIISALYDHLWIFLAPAQCRKSYQSIRNTLEKGQCRHLFGAR